MLQSIREAVRRLQNQPLIQNLLVEEGVLHYCVANMPGAVPMTSTYALNNATISYVLSLANNGFNAALTLDDGFL